MRCKIEIGSEKNVLLLPVSEENAAMIVGTATMGCGYDR